MRASSQCNSAELTSPVNISYNYCSGNFSSCSSGVYQHYPGYFCGSLYHSNLVYSTDLCSPGTCQLGSSLYKSFQEICWDTPSCHMSCVESSPCQTCYRPRTSLLCSPCQTTYSGSLGFGSSSCHSLGYGSRSCYSVGCGSSGFRSLHYGGCGISSLGCGSGFCPLTYVLSRTFQSSYYRPTCGSGFYRSTC
ncbi:keratin-associated protein 13-1-like [Trachypithecus francoisi]|uniref:keratin-associated protein 13-1-like n=1 Tax=Trachypithecus francoisi TaxID=54180 RepID=UPI00141B6AB8|nr:keratin-associated protein 13-1-like [Trachypithecus francoisi]